MLLHKSVEHDSRVRREASALAAAGHHVTVLELAAVAPAERTLDGFRRRSVLPAPWLRRGLPAALRRPLMLVWFVLGVVSERPDVVHAHDAAMLAPGLVGARLVGARLVYDSHELATGVPYRERAWASLVGAIERLAVPRCDAVITVSQGIAERLAERYRPARTPLVLRNVATPAAAGRADGADGADGLRRTLDAGGLRRTLRIGPEAPLVLHQGAPAPDRGCEVLVDAVTRLPGVRLAFLGDPEPGYGERLAALIALRGVGDRVSLLPSVPLAELLSWTAEADVGVTLLQDSCENHRLALPNKLFEYIAAGVPVVAGELPEIGKLVRGYGVGWCVAPDDPAAVADGLTAALRHRRDPQLQERLARAASELSWSREQVRLIELYRWLQRPPCGRGQGRRAAAPTKPEQRPLLLLVRNAVSHDARVLRAARVGRRLLGGEPLIVGVASDDAAAGPADVDGIDVLRLRRWGRFRRRRPAPASPVRAPGNGANRTGISLGGRLRRILNGLAFIAEATAVARRARPAVVHANDWNTMWAGIAIKLSCGSKLIYDSHELWPDRNGRWELRPWLVACEAVFVRAADRVLATSPGHAHVLASRYRVPPPLVVRNIPERVASRPVVPDQPPVAAYVGGLMPGRGLERMIDALALVPQLRLRAVGPGAAAYRAALAQRAADRGVDRRVSLLSPVAPSEIPSALAGAAFGLCLIEPVCRSYELSLPNKLFEYLAAGLPVLAGSVPVIAEVVRDGGLGQVVVGPGDPAAIADAARRLLDPDIRSAAVAAAAAFAAANSWERESGLLGDVYEALGGGRTRGSFFEVR